MLVDLCKDLIASLCNHTSEVWYCAWLVHRGWVQSYLNFYKTCVEMCTTFEECKTNILVMLMVKSCSDPHILNIGSKSNGHVVSLLLIFHL